MLLRVKYDIRAFRVITTGGAFDTFRYAFMSNNSLSELIKEIAQNIIFRESNAKFNY